MFERFKAYRNLRRHEKIMKGFKKLGEIQGDDELIRVANETLYLQAKIKRDMWANRKLAINYNLRTIKDGLNDL